MGDEKKRVQETNDIILEVGKEGKQGIKNAKEYFGEIDKQNKREKDVQKEILSTKKLKRQYNAFLAKVLLDDLSNVEWQAGWRYQVAPTDIGIILELSYKKKYYRSAFRSTGIPDLDLNAVNHFVLRTQSTVDKNSQPNGFSEKNGLLVPQK